jgi:predicted metal-dependent HD superfamily phosphohydrolase
MNYTEAYNYALEKLGKDLPDYLYYHGKHHTLDVLDAAIKIAEFEGIQEEEQLTLLRTACLFHDIGFTISGQEHEKIGCGIVEDILPALNYSSDQIVKIQGMIMATKIPQSPKSKLEEIICDADLDYLGRDDFFSIGNTLYEELKYLGVVHDELSWNNLQVRFLSSHAYFTEWGNQKRQSKKSEHLKIVEKLTRS